MKHHFADLLDRSGGHWSMTPNRERWADRPDEKDGISPGIRTLMLSKSDCIQLNADDLRSLEELTLHEPSHAHLELVMQLDALKRLRITHARPKTLDFLRGLSELEELVLEYVSGVDDLRPIGSLPKLRALHLENLRRVRDFSGLSGARELRYLAIDGTFDWSQSISDLTFVSSLAKLEYFTLRAVRILAKPPATAPLLKLENLEKISLFPNILPLDDYAYLAAGLPDVEGASQPPFEITPHRERELIEPDIRATMPVDELKHTFPDVLITDDGKRIEVTPEQTFFLGRGQRTASGVSPAIVKRREDYAAQYQELIEKYRRVLGAAV